MNSFILSYVQFLWSHSAAFFLTKTKPDLLYFDNIWTNYFLEQSAPTLG